MKKILILLALFVYANANTLTLPGSFKAHFTQTITNPKGKRIDYQGTVQFSNSTFLKWSYKKPTKKEVCISQTQMRVVDHDLEQVSEYYIDKGFNFLKILTQAKHHKDNTYITSYENKRYTIRVDNKKRLQSFAFFDDLDNKVQVSFKRIRYSKRHISAKRMRCSAPKQYDMIRG